MLIQSNMTFPILRVLSLPLESDFTLFSCNCIAEIGYLTHHLWLTSLSDPIFQQLLLRPNPLLSPSALAIYSSLPYLLD